MNLLARLRKLDTIRRNKKQRPERIALEEALKNFKPGDVAIDCGANVGTITELFAQAGAEVYAFEPHPAAFSALSKRVQSYPNAKAFQACITADGKPVKLYLHKWDQEDPAYWSTGSSIIAEKRNVEEGRSVEVEGVNLVEFIKQLAKPVGILKMDIEGAEVAVLNHLLDEGLHERIGQAFVEVHAIQIPHLAKATEKLRDRLESMGATHFRLDWR